MQHYTLLMPKPTPTPAERQLCALARQHAAAVAFIAALLADDSYDLTAARERLDRLARDTNHDLELVLVRLARIGARGRPGHSRRSRRLA